jgi:hypothetical protein
MITELLMLDAPCLLLFFHYIKKEMINPPRKISFLKPRESMPGKTLPEIKEQQAYARDAAEFLPFSTIFSSLPEIPLTPAVRVQHYLARDLELPEHDNMALKIPAQAAEGEVMAVIIHNIVVSAGANLASCPFRGLLASYCAVSAAGHVNAECGSAFDKFRGRSCDDAAVTLKGDYLSIPDIDPGMLRGMKCKIAVDNRSRHRLYKSCLRLRVFIKVNTGEH